MTYLSHVEVMSLWMTTICLEGFLFILAFLSFSRQVPAATAGEDHTHVPPVIWGSRIFCHCKTRRSNHDLLGTNPWGSKI